MPFKLKLKKTRQYVVASKSLFVISVELLDGGVADCTLSVESTGQECRDTVCQRQALGQPALFGLRYVTRGQQARWVQLERPLKRQLDKHAASHHLHLRVMYYVLSGTTLITDEVTRYHYFLQLKNDLIEGRIICDLQQAVVLASYSRQAEYGNHDRERHTVEYLKNLLTFPKQMLDNGQVIEGSSLADTGRLEWLTAAVIQHHMALHNMSQAQAEEGFITACQQLRGYGQEMFLARETGGGGGGGRDVTLAVSLQGVQVLADDDPPTLYRWSDITNVINHKRTFSVETGAGATRTFSLPAPEDGKYVWRLCVLYHTFHVKHGAGAGAGATATNTNLANKEQPPSSWRVSQLSAPWESLRASHRAHSTSCLELSDPLHAAAPAAAPANAPNAPNRAQLPQYRPAPDYDTAVRRKFRQQRPGAPLAYGSHPDIHRIHYPDVTRHTVSLNQPLPADEYYNVNLLTSTYPFAVNPALQRVPVAVPVPVAAPGQFRHGPPPPPPYPAGANSSSTPDLARAPLLHHVSGSSPDLLSTRSCLSHHLPYMDMPPLIKYSAPPPEAPSPRLVLDPHHVSDTFRDDRGNLMYSRPVSARPPPARPSPSPPPRPSPPPPPPPSPPPSPVSREPIYENVPLPAPAARHTLAAPTQMTRLKDRTASQPAINKLCDTSSPAGAADRTDRTDRTHRTDRTDRTDPRGHDVSATSIESVGTVTARTERERETDAARAPRRSVCRAADVSRGGVTSITVGGAAGGGAAGGGGAGGGAAGGAGGGRAADTSHVKEEKKRRRWGVWMGRRKEGEKEGEVKSATLGREREREKRPPPAPPHKQRWSTGLPKCQPLPSSISKETLCQVLERRLSSDQLSFSFEQIPRGRPAASVQPPVHQRDHEYLPYEDNRVRLAPTADNPHGYVNASHITMTVGSTQRFYVIGKVGDDPPALVWATAWQTGARVIAMVGPGATHLPPDNDTIQYGQFTVTTSSSSIASWGASVAVRVRCERGLRTVWHVWHKDQPRHVDKLLSFLLELGELRQVTEAEAAAAAGAGAGRRAVSSHAPLQLVCASGTAAGLALAADLLLHVLDHNQELDIPRTVCLLHQQRAGLVPHEQHYRLLHRLLLHYLAATRLI